MQYTIIRRIGFATPVDGHITKIVAKDIESDVSPQIGYEYEDSAWFRHDIPKVESVRVDANTGHCTVELEHLDAGSVENVERIFATAVSHGWRDWLLPKQVAPDVG